MVLLRLDLALATDLRRLCRTEAYCQLPVAIEIGLVVIRSVDYENIFKKD